MVPLNVESVPVIRIGTGNCVNVMQAKRQTRRILAASSRKNIFLILFFSLQNYFICKFVEDIIFLHIYQPLIPRQ